VIQSWYEAPTIEDGDPWDLETSNQYTREWQWHERRLETAIADGSGEEDTNEEGNRDLATDGGERSPDGKRAGSSDGADGAGIANTTDTAERNG
jgi:cytochrome c oxidase subunit 1